MKRLSDYTYHSLTKKESYEHIAFIVIIAVFSLGLFSNLSYTGKVTGETNYEMVSIDELFNETATYTLVLKGNVTSLRANGEFIGNGLGRIYVNGILIVDSNDLENKNNLITGFVVSEEAEPEMIIDLNTDINDSDPEIVVNLTDSLPNDLDDVEISNEMILFNGTNQEIIIDENIQNNSDLSIDENETNIIEEVISEPSLDIKKFSNYCLESCSLNLHGEVTLRIELVDMMLNLSDIVYGYEETEEIGSNETIIEIIDEIINETLNVSLNITDLNQSLISNFSLNVTNATIQNLSIVNLTDLNISSNISMNLSILNETDTNITNLENITEIINVTEQITRQLNLTIFEESEFYITAGIDLKNYIKFQKEVDSYVAIYNSSDSRINSKVILLENISYAEIILEGDANVVLKCEQYDGYCKKWRKTSIIYENLNDSTKFIVNESGIYVTANLIYDNPEKIESSTVYLNSDCDYCEKTYNCNVEQFCVSQNTAGHRVTFTAQFDFDILNIESNIKNAQVCALRYYHDEPSFNYIKYSPENHCSAKYQNSTSDIISYKFVSAKDGFVCIDATEILNYALENKESNVFINWLGQDLNGDSFPLSCFYGNVSNCGHDSCKPYVRLEYE